MLRYAPDRYGPFFSHFRLQSGWGQSGSAAAFTPTRSRAPLPSHLPFIEARATALWSEDFVISGATGAGFAQAFIVGAVGATIGEGSLGMTLWQAIPNGFSGGWLDPMPVTFGAPYTFSIRGFTGCRTGESGCGDQSAPCSAGSCTTGTF